MLSGATPGSVLLEAEEQKAATSAGMQPPLNTGQQDLEVSVEELQKASPEPEPEPEPVSF